MTLFDYSAIEKRLNETDIYTLIADCDAILAENPTEFMRLLRSALSLSAHVLEKDKSALAHQLAGRLYHHVDKNADIKAFVDGIIPPKNSLYPIYNGYDPLIPAGGMLVRMMKHDDEINEAKALSDGRILSWDNTTLRLWNEYGRLLNIMTGHSIAINGVLILSDERILSWDANGTIQLWDRNGILLKIFNTQDKNILTDLRVFSAGQIITTRSVNRVIELSNGRILSAHSDGNVRIWNNNAELLFEFTAHEGRTNILELPKDKILTYYFRVVKIWNSKGHLLKEIKHQHEVSQVLLTKNGFLSVERDGSLILRDKNGRLIASFGKSIFKAWVLTNGRIVSSNFDYTIDLWDEYGKHLATMDGHTKTVVTVLELRDGHLLSGSHDNIARLWSADGELLNILPLDGLFIHGLELADGRIMTSSASKDDVQFWIRLWDKNGNPINDFNPLPYGFVGSVLLANDRVLSWYGRTLRILDIKEPPLSHRQSHSSVLQKIIILPDKLVLSTSLYQYTVRLWHKNGQPATDLSHYSSWNEPDVILDNIRIMNVISPYNHLSFRYIHGLGYPPPYGYEWAEHGAEDLPENWLIYWEEGAGEIHIEDEQENLVTTLDEFYLGNRERIFAWLRESGINPDVAYPEAEFPALNGWRVSYDRDSNLIIYDSQTGKTIYTFYGDSKFTSIAVVDDVVIAGDKAGRVIFLRWVE